MAEDVLTQLHRRMTFPFPTAEDGLLVVAAAAEIERLRAVLRLIVELAENNPSNLCKTCGE